MERKQGQRTGSPRDIYVARADGESMAPTQVTKSSGDEGEHDWQALPKCTKTGTADNDTLTGTSGRYVLCGAAGEDSIDGVGGNHILITGAGNRLAGPAGNDILNGARARTPPPMPAHADLANLTTGFAKEGGQQDALVNLERLNGSSAADTWSGRARSTCSTATAAQTGSAPRTDVHATPPTVERAATAPLETATRSRSVP